MANRWYYKIENEIVGPVDDGQLESAVKSGAINRSSRVRLGENGPWGPASLVSGLFSAAPEFPPTVDPVDEFVELQDDLLSELEIDPLNLAPPRAIAPVKPRSRSSAPAREWRFVGLAATALATLLIAVGAAIWILSPGSSTEEAGGAAAGNLSPTTPSSSVTASNQQPALRDPPAPAEPSRATSNPLSSDSKQTVLYLSDLKETRHEVWEYHPGFGFGTNGKFLDGKVEKPIVLGGMPSPKGILAHPKTNGVSRVIYDLKGRQYKYFEATIGVNDERRYGPHTPLIFEVLGNGKLLWQSKPVARWGQPQPCSIALPQISELELRVRCPGDASFAFAVWCEPKLTNEASPLPQQDLFPVQTASNASLPDKGPGTPGPTARGTQSKSDKPTDRTLHTIVLPSGAVIDLSHVTLTLAAAKAAFTNRSGSSGQPKGKSKPSPLAHFPVPNGLLTYNNEGELHGPVLIVAENRRPKMFLSYANNRRDGVWRCWNEEGELEVSFTYKNGHKLGVTLIYLAGQPLVVEDWGTDQNANRYLIKFVDNVPTFVGVGQLDNEARQLLRDSEKRLETQELQLTENERQWKQSLRTWWNKNESELKRMNQSLAAAKSQSGRSEWQLKIKAKLAQLQAEGDQALQEFLSRF